MNFSKILKTLFFFILILHFGKFFVKSDNFLFFFFGGGWGWIEWEAKTPYDAESIQKHLKFLTSQPQMLQWGNLPRLCIFILHKIFNLAKFIGCKRA